MFLFKASLSIYDEQNGIEIPMSIQQCYENFFPSVDFILNEYRIYSSLVYYGYIVRRKANRKNKSKSVDAIDFERKEKFNKTNEPIINKNDYGKLTKKEIFERLDSLMPNITIEDLKKKIGFGNNNSKESNSVKFRSSFDAYTPNKNFKKSQPGEPNYKVISQIGKTCMPKLVDFLVNDDSNEELSLDKRAKNIYAFVNNSDVTYYSFNYNFKLPVI